MSGRGRHKEYRRRDGGGSRRQEGGDVGLGKRYDYDEDNSGPRKADDNESTGSRRYNGNGGYSGSRRPYGGDRRFFGTEASGSRGRDSRRRRGFERRPRDNEENDRDKDETGQMQIYQTKNSRVSEADDSLAEDGMDKKTIVLAKSSRMMEREKADRLDQEFPALKKTEVSPSKVTEGREEEEIPGGAGVILLKQRESLRSGPPATNSAPRIVGKKESVDKSNLKQASPLKIVDESSTFCDGVIDYLTDNQDFIVVGVLGLQNTGKSTILNMLAKNSPQDEEIFRVQSYEHQMLAEHCTNGIDVYINSRRHIFLDCQPLLSSSIMDRSIQLEKKFNTEFSTAENTIEVQSLQLIGFLFSVCHTVLLVQDWFMDFSLVRLMQAAETLKPMTPTISEKDNQLTEYFPHFVLVHNKCEVADFEDDMTDEMKEVYSLVWSKSRLNWSDKDSGEPNLALLPDMFGERADSLPYRIRPRIDFDRASRQLRNKVFSMPKKPLSQQGKMSERSWLSLASKTWENIKNSPTYMEYSRLLPIT